MSSTFVRTAALGAALAWLTPLNGRGAPAGATVRVQAGGDLQAALDAARPGDTLLLAPGAEFVGNFVLPAKDGDAWITIRSDVTADAVPPAGRRIGPQNEAQLAAIRSPNANAALRTAPAAHHWRLELLEFPAAGSTAATLVELGDGGQAQRELRAVPHDLVIDRCAFTGHPENGQKRGLALNSASTRVTGSHFQDFKARGQETQAIAGWNGPGPFHIENNYLEAAGVIVLFGGADPAIPGLVPSDITFRRNLVSRPAAWRQQPWLVKNLFELKMARRVLVEQNVFERNWRGGQSGYAILFTTANSGGHAPWATIEDVTFRHNIVRHAGGGINILGRDQHGDPSGVASRIRISGNLLYDIDGAEWGGAGIFLLIGEGPEQIVVENNTVIHTGNVISAYGGSASRPVPVRGFTFRDNLMRHNRYGVHGDGQSVGAGTIAAYFPGALFSWNVLAGGQASRYPAGNMFPSVEEFEGSFVDFTAGDYRLKPESAFFRSSTDGGPIGAPAEVFKLLGEADPRRPPPVPTSIRRAR